MRPSLRHGGTIAVWLITIMIVVGGFGPTVWRIWTGPTEEYLEFAPMEQQLLEQFAGAIVADTILSRRVEIHGFDVRTERLLDEGVIPRWSYAGQQLVNVAHRLRRLDDPVVRLSVEDPNGPILSELVVLDPAWRDKAEERYRLEINRGAFNILSPFIERRRNIVLSRDARQGAALVRDGSVVYFDQPSRIPIPETFPPDWCAAVRFSATLGGVRCGTAAGGLGIERLREFDIRLLIDEVDASVPPRLVAAARRRVVVDGRDVYPDTIELRPGQLLRSTGIPTSYIALANSGTIVDTQTVNGRSTLLVTNRRYGQIGMALAKIRRADGRFSDIPVSVSPQLTSMLDSIVRGAVRRANRAGRADAFRVTNVEVVAIDLSRGDILAFAGSKDPGIGAFLPGTTNRFIGSAVKPMIAAAVLSAHPELASLTVSSTAQASAVDGQRLLKPFNAGCGGGSVDLRRAMRCSSNLFAAELLVRGLRQDGVGRERGDTTRYAAGPLAISAVLQQMGTIGDVSLDARGGELNTAPWEVNDREGVGALFVRSHGGLLPERSAPRFIIQAGVGPTLGQVVRIAYGQEWNEWTLLDAATAFGRVATGRDIHSRFLIYPDSTPLPSSLPWRGAPWHRSLLQGLTDVVRHPEGTAGEVGGRVDQNVGRSVRLVGKTGSPDFDDDDFLESNAFVGAISLRPSAPDEPLVDGIAFALSVDYADPGRRRDRAQATEARRNLRVHRELAAEIAMALAAYLRYR